MITARIEVFLTYDKPYGSYDMPYETYFIRNFKISYREQHWSWFHVLHMECFEQLPSMISCRRIDQVGHVQ